MNILFHYYCIKALAREAGFSPDEAETIAYASQYVDDATEHKPIAIQNAPPEAEEQHIGGRFEPVCTAHSGLQYLTCGNQDVQRLIYIAFHFVPGDEYVGSGAYDYCVRPNGKIASDLLDNALTQLGSASIGSLDRKRALIRTGIALHSFADTWAHQGFSGRHSAHDNDIQDRARFEDGEWQPLGFFERAALDILPDIGHAEAGVMPDVGHLQWRYRRASSTSLSPRNNTEEFLAAAEEIFSRLMKVGSPANPMPQAQIRKCLSDCQNSPTIWTETFPSYFSSGHYDKLAWRNQALHGSNVDWDRYTTASEFAALQFKYASDPAWLLFHAEAGKQRDYVLRRIKFDLQ
jgi:hypothetical protein